MSRLWLSACFRSCGLSVTVSLCACFGYHISDCNCQSVCGLRQSHQWLSACVRALAVISVTFSLCAGFGFRIGDCQSVCGLGHVDFGVKWEILPLCLKGKFYANHAFVHKGKILRQGCRCVHNDSILRHWFWRKIPLWRVMATFTKVTHTWREILRQRAKLLGLPLMCLIDRAYPIQVTAYR